MEWISIKDRLPERGQTVIAWVLMGEMLSSYHLMQYISQWNEDITHWMPLPEPPKE